MVLTAESTMILGVSNARVPMRHAAVGPSDMWYIWCPIWMLPILPTPSGNGRPSRALHCGQVALLVRWVVIDFSSSVCFPLLYAMLCAPCRAGLHTETFEIGEYGAPLTSVSKAERCGTNRGAMLIKAERSLLLYEAVAMIIAVEYGLWSGNSQVAAWVALLAVAADR